MYRKGSFHLDQMARYLILENIIIKKLLKLKTSYENVIQEFNQLKPQKALKKENFTPRT